MRLIKLSVTLLPVFIVLHAAGVEAQLQVRQGAPSGQRQDQTGESPPPPIGGTSRAAGIDVPLGGTNEQAIAVNPLNPLNIIASSLFSYRVSNDGGNTWTGSISNVVPAGYVRNGDPALAFNSQGRLFYTYQGFFIASGGSDEFVSELNPTTGALIAGPVQVSTSGPAGGENDKPWIAVDRWVGSPFQDRLYLVWTEFPVAAAERVLFAFSSNHGVTWSAPVQLSVGGEGFVWPPHIAVAPNGDVYISYHSQTAFNGIGEFGGNPTGTSGKVFVLRSTNGGVSFPQKTLAFTAGQADITYNVQSSPGTIPNTDFWLQGSGQAWVLPDPLTPGNVYVVANDDPDNMHGSGDDADVVIARSTNNGLTWSAPTRVDHGPGTTFQVMPTAAIDDSTGCIVVMWYDNRLGGFNGNGNSLLDVFYTVSADGGLTFSADIQLNDVPFDPDLGAPQRLPGPPPTLRIGEYMEVAFSGTNVSGVWTGNTGGGQQAVFDTALGICGGDCNNNGIADGLEIALGAGDCDGDLILDECEVDPLDPDGDGQVSADCQPDGIPDECQLASPFSAYLLDDGTHELANGVPNGGDTGWLNHFVVQTGAGKIGAISLTWGQIPDGTPATVYLWSDPNGDGNPTDAQVLASASTSSANADTDIFSTVDITDTLIGPAGTSFFAGAIVSHQAGERPTSLDQDTNSGQTWVMGDDVNPLDPNNLGAAGFLPPTNTNNTALIRAVTAGNDCNNNGIPDECDIADGTSQDCNGNVFPDECEFPGCPGILLADMNCDGSRNGVDIQPFVERVVANAYTCQADMNQDGLLNPADMAGFVAAILAGP